MGLWASGFRTSQNCQFHAVTAELGASGWCGSHNGSGCPQLGRRTAQSVTSCPTPHNFASPRPLLQGGSTGWKIAHQMSLTPGPQYGNPILHAGIHAVSEAVPDS